MLESLTPERIRGRADAVHSPPGAGSTSRQTSVGASSQSPAVDQLVRRQILVEQAAVADQRQAELAQAQWSLVRDQICTFSKEVVSIRDDLCSLQLVVSQLRQEHGDGGLLRKELEAKMEGQIKAASLQSDSANRGLQAEVSERREIQERLHADLHALEEKLFQESRRNHDAHGERFDRLAHGLHTDLEQEGRERFNAIADLERRLQDIAALIQQEHNQREAGEVQLRLEINASKKGYPVDRQEFDQLQARLTQFSTLESKVERKVSELHDADVLMARQFETFQRAFDIDAESRQRANERSEQRWTDLHNTLVIETTRCKDDVAEAGRALQSLKQTTEQEAQRQWAELQHTTSAVLQLEANIKAQRQWAELQHTTSAVLQLEANIKADSRTLEQEQRRHLEEESRVSASSLQIQSEMEAKFVDTSKALLSIEERLTAVFAEVSGEATDRAAANEQLVARIEKLQLLIAGEANDRQKAEEDLLKQLHGNGKALQAEVVVRESAISSLKVEIEDCRNWMHAEKQDLKQLQLSLENEACERGREISSLSMTVSKATLAAADQEKMEQLQKQLDTEINNRSRSSSDLSERLIALTDAVRLEAQQRGLVEEETKRKLEQTRSWLDDEVKTEASRRNEESAALKEAVKMMTEQTMQFSTQVTLDLRTELEGRLTDVATLRDQIEEESRQRTLGDDEVARMSLQAQQLLENEKRDRQCEVEGLSKKLRELQDLVVEDTKTERSERVNLASDILTQVRSLTSSLSHETEEQVKKVEAIARSALLVRSNIDEESRERVKVEEEFTIQLARTASDVSQCKSELESLRAENQCCGKTIADAQNQIKSLSDSLSNEKQQRIAGDKENKELCISESTARGKSIHQCEHEIRGLESRSQADLNSLKSEFREELRLQELAIDETKKSFNALDLSSTLQELKDAFQSDFKSHFTSIKALDERLTQVETFLEQDAKVRDLEEKKSREFFAADFADMQQELSSLKHAVEEEVKSQQVLDERIKRNSEDLIAESSCHAEAIGNLQRRIDAEGAARKEDLAKTSASLAQTKSQVQENTNVFADLSDKLENLAAKVTSDMTKWIEEVAGTIGQMEASLQEEAKHQHEKLQAQIDKGAGEHSLEGERLQKEMKRIQEKLDIDMSERSLEGTRLERDLQNVQKQLDKEVKDRSVEGTQCQEIFQSMQEQLDKVLRIAQRSVQESGVLEDLLDVKTQLTKEISDRASEGTRMEGLLAELRAGFTNASEELKESIQLQCQKDSAEIAAQFEALCDGLETEAKERAAQAEKLMHATTQANEQSEKEVQERQIFEKDLQKILREVIEDLAKFRTEHEAVQDDLRTQFASYRESSARDLESATTDAKAALEIERQQRIAGDEAQTNARKHELGEKLSEEMISFCEAQVALESRLSQTVASLREELGLQEAVLIAAEASIKSLKDALSHEASARSTADQELKQILDSWIANESQSLVADVMRTLRSDLDVETKRLWMAIDSHTHDVSMLEDTDSPMAKMLQRSSREMPRMLASARPKVASEAANTVTPALSVSSTPTIAGSMDQLLLSTATLPKTSARPIESVPEPPILVAPFDRSFLQASLQPSAARQRSSVKADQMPSGEDFASRQEVEVAVGQARYVQNAALGGSVLRGGSNSVASAEHTDKLFTANLEKASNDLARNSFVKEGRTSLDFHA